MNVRVVWERLVARRRWKRSRAAMPAASVVAAVALGLAWACAPRGAEVPVAPGVVAQGFVAAPAPAVPAPAASAASARVTPVRLAPSLAAVERELAAAARVAREAAEREEADRERAEREAAEREASSSRTFPVARSMEMRSTAYCLKGNMRTGVRTRDGMAAADPSVIPLGSVVRVSHTDGRVIGIFVIMDTGGAVRGNKLDIYMDSCREASDWGIKRVVAEVLDIGRA